MKKTGRNLLPKHQRFPQALMLAVVRIVSLAVLAVGIFLAWRSISWQLAMDKAARQENTPAETGNMPRDEIQNPLVQPSGIRIPALNVQAPVIPLGLSPDGTVQVPSDGSQAGWYKNGAVPGQAGSAVIIGHLDSPTGPALFYRLKNLKAGDLVEITRSDGSRADFVVESLENYPQDGFPTEKVYGNLDYPGLRLITCSGKYLKNLGRYSDNLVVYARLASN